MRIVYIHQYFKSEGGRSYEMARRFAARGHEVHMVTSTSDPQAPPVEHIKGITVHWLQVPYSQLMPHAERIKAFLSFAARASATARKLHGDVVYATSTPLTVAIPGIAATIFRKRPLVFEVRDLWPDVPIAMGALNNPVMRGFAKLLEKATYAYSNHVVALSPDMKQVIVDKGVTPDKVTVVPNASDNDNFENLEVEAKQFRAEYEWLGDRPMVLYCGTLGKVNDVSYIARLAAAVQQHNDQIRFVIVGRGNDEETVRATAVQLGVFEQNFFMLPRVPKTQVPRIFAAADISMSTVAPIAQLNANSANKVFDTLASGTPLAINHRGWLAEMIHETNCGLVLDQLNMDDAARDVIEFLNAPNARQEAARNAKRLAVERFDRQKLTDTVANLLERARHIRPRRQQPTKSTPLPVNTTR